MGGKLEALIPEGSRYATTEMDDAVALAQARLDELEKKRRERPAGPAAKRRLDVLIPDHLKRKVMNVEASEQWLGNVQVHLETAEDYCGADRAVA